MIKETRLESADEVLDEQRAGDGAGLQHIKIYAAATVVTGILAVTGLLVVTGLLIVTGLLVTGLLVTRLLVVTDDLHKESVINQE